MSSAYLTQSLKRAAQVNRAGIATICGARRRNWTEVRDRVARLAGALRQLGLTEGGRVAVIAMNSDRYFELHYAAPWAGGALVPINTRLALAEVHYLLEDSGAEVLLTDDTCLPMLQGLTLPAAVKAKIHMGEGDAPQGWYAYETLLAASAPASDAERHGRDLAGIFYTGGSTGKAKGVMLSHDNIVSNAMNAIYLIGYDRSSVFLHIAPMFHLTDGTSTYSLTMVAGTHVFVPKFEAGACLAAVAEHRVTNLTLVPTMISMLLSHSDLARHELSSLRQIMFGSSPIPEATLRRATEVWSAVKLLHGWGMTELSPIGTMLPHELRLPAVAGARLRSCGQAVLNCEVLVVDEHGDEVPRGTVGELVLRGPTVMLGYWNKPSETAAALRGGWMRTGDAATMDEDGFFYIVDRLKDMIISGGENVYSNEVENVISLIPGVAEVAVIGIPDERWGERVHAVVVPKPGAALTEEAIREYCRGSIAGYKVPRSVEFRAAPLPLSGSGKVLKTALRAPHWSGAGKAVN